MIAKMGPSDSKVFFMLTSSREKKTALVVIAVPSIALVVRRWGTRGIYDDSDFRWIALIELSAIVAGVLFGLWLTWLRESPPKPLSSAKFVVALCGGIWGGGCVWLLGGGMFFGLSRHIDYLGPFSACVFCCGASLCVAILRSGAAPDRLGATPSQELES